MDIKPCLATTPAGKTYNVAWRGDTKGGGARPNVPVKKRSEFIADVRGEHAPDGTPMELAAIKKKWAKLFTSERTLFKWIKWARELQPIEGATDAGQ